MIIMTKCRTVSFDVPPQKDDADYDDDYDEQCNIHMMIIMTKYRTVSFDVPPQEILTKDSVTVAVDAVVYYKVS